jgi:hypothetical protein
LGSAALQNIDNMSPAVPWLGQDGVWGRIFKAVLKIYGGDLQMTDKPSVGIDQHGGNERRGSSIDSPTQRADSDASRPPIPN